MMTKNSNDVVADGAEDIDEILSKTAEAVEEESQSGESDK